MSLERWDRTLSSEPALQNARSYDPSPEDLPSIRLSESGTSIHLRLRFFLLLPLLFLLTHSATPLPFSLSHHQPKILPGRLHRLIPHLPTSRCLTRQAAASGGSDLLSFIPCPTLSGFSPPPSLSFILLDCSDPGTIQIPDPSRLCLTPTSSLTDSLLCLYTGSLDTGLFHRTQRCAHIYIRPWSVCRLGNPNLGLICLHSPM